MVLKRIKAHRKTDQDLEEVNDSSFIHFDKVELIVRGKVKFQQKQKLQQVLNQLSKRQREIIYLNYYNAIKKEY